MPVSGAWSPWTASVTQGLQSPPRRAHADLEAPAHGIGAADAEQVEAPRRAQHPARGTLEIPGPTAMPKPRAGAELAKALNGRASSDPRPAAAPRTRARRRVIVVAPTAARVARVPEGATPARSPATGSRTRAGRRELRSRRVAWRSWRSHRNRSASVSAPDAHGPARLVSERSRSSTVSYGAPNRREAAGRLHDLGLYNEHDTEYFGRRPAGPGALVNFRAAWWLDGGGDPLRSAASSDRALAESATGRYGWASIPKAANGSRSSGTCCRCC